MVALGRDSHNIDGNSRPIRIRGLKNNLLNLLDKNIRVNSWSVQFLVDGWTLDGGRFGELHHSTALHACRAQKGGEDSDNETDYFCPSVLFHGDRGAHPSPSQREGALPLTWVTAACWRF